MHITIKKQVLPELWPHLYMCVTSSTLDSDFSIQMLKAALGHPGTDQFIFT